MKKLIFFLSFLLTLLVAVNSYGQNINKTPIAQCRLCTEFEDTIFGIVQVCVTTAVDINKILGKTDFINKVDTFFKINNFEFGSYTCTVSKRKKLINIKYLENVYITPLMEQCFLECTKIEAMKIQQSIIEKRIKEGYKIILLP
jgi:hypothetical protein